MRAKPLVLVASLVLSGIATKGQKAVVAVTKDPQAVSILNQSLSAVGGVTTVNGIQDYTASGSIAYNWAGESVSGSATLRGMGISNFRLDANLPDGMRTYAVSGVSGVLITPDGTRQATPFYNLFTEGSATIPYVRILADLADTTTSISLVTSPSTNGVQQPYQIHFVQSSPIQNAAANSLPGIGAFDIYIDPASFLVTRLVETVRSESDFNTALTRELDFSNYQTVGNMSAPFTISESINGQQTWSVTIISLSFNSGLTSAIFTP